MGSDTPGAPKKTDQEVSTLMLGIIKIPFPHVNLLDHHEEPS